MNKPQLKPVAKAMVLAFALAANASHSAETAKPTAPLLSEVRHFIPGPSKGELEAHREAMKKLAGFWPITVALTTRDARNPQPLSKEWQQRISDAAGMPMEYQGVGGGDEHRFITPKKMIPAEVEEIAARIRALPGILYAEIPQLEPSFNLAVATDPLYSSQWNLQDAGGGASLPSAWDITTGNNAMVVAVIDTGVLSTHSELSGRVLPGYDFISEPARANDGEGREANATDPGNWVSTLEAVGACKAAPSNWHGTRVSSIVAANTNNGIGMAGVDWQVKILPVRVSGKCILGLSSGVYDENDLKDAVRWAAGISIPGVPTNASPARVINISLGRPSACSSQMQSAIDDARKAGAVVVAAVGNKGEIGAYSPANCNGVIRVAAVNQGGGLAKYSNRGEAATLSAPGGEFTDPLEIKTAADGGATTPLNDSVIKGDMVGTSFASPHVAGVAALIRAIKPEMSPQQVAAILANTTRNFPTGTSFDCDNITCGTGILDAGQAVAGARAKVSAGGYHTVAAKADGSVVTWGRNSYGQLGGGESLSLSRPYPGSPLPSLSGVRDVAAGIWHTIALKSDGTVWGWGYNGQGMIGNGTTSTQVTPVRASGLTDAIAIAAGDRHSLALKSDGTVWAWGLNASGQLGRGVGNYTNSLVPVQVSGLTGVIAISAGGKRSMALKSDGTVWAWGMNANATSNTSATASPIPVQVPGLADIVAIAAGGSTSDTVGAETDASFALSWDGQVYAWGYNNHGQLCHGDLVSRFLPSAITLSAPAIKISAGEYDSVILLDDGTLVGCGLNFGGAMGDGTTTTRKSPSPVGSGLNEVMDIDVGRDYTVSMGNNLSVEAWGFNNYGQLGNGVSGNGSAARSLVPVQVHGAGNSGYFNAAYATSTSADLAVTLSDSPDPLTVNANLTYDLQLINYGPNQATGVSTVLSLPSQVSFVSATSGCSHANGLVTCTIASLNNAANAAFQVVVKPTVAKTLDTTASVSSSVFDPVNSNNATGTSTVANAGTPTDGDVPIPAWALAALGAGLLGSMRRMSSGR